MNIEIITQPAFEPVTLVQAKLAARVDAADEDALWTGIIIPGCRQDCEQILGRAIMAQGLRLTLDGFPACREIRLPRPRLLSVESVEYRAQLTGAWSVLDPALYETDTAATPGRVVLIPTASWPGTYGMPGSVRVNYTAGYAAGTEAVQQAAVPASVKRWILARTTTAYDFRDELIAGTIVSALPNRFVDSALDRERVYGI
jgi:uncharacterized phiE125 gp8 family phage protein